MQKPIGKKYALSNKVAERLYAVRSDGGRAASLIEFLRARKKKGTDCLLRAIGSPSIFLLEHGDLLRHRGLSFISHHRGVCRQYRCHLYLYLCLYLCRL